MYKRKDGDNKTPWEALQTGGGRDLLIGRAKMYFPMIKESAGWFPSEGCEGKSILGFLGLENGQPLPEASHCLSSVYVSLCLNFPLYKDIFILH